jgi:hypothetical protein
MTEAILKTLRDAAGDTPAPARGRVLSIKPGYNPNSSSVGSVISVLFWSATAATAALNLAAALVARRAAESTEPPES